MLSSGDATLDAALDGGFPQGRAVVVSGGPGTGKTTLGLQFLQAGLEAGEQCLFVSTEQTPEELRDSVAPFEFDLDHENLDVGTIHATPGRTLESEKALTLQTAHTRGDEPFAVPFEHKYIVDYLEQFGEFDRVVFDSLSGLRPAADDETMFAQLTLGLMRFLTHDLGATALVTTEGTEGAMQSPRAVSGTVYDAPKFKAHGVVRLWREHIGGEYHRFLEVLKIRGQDHDLRRFEITIDDDGVRCVPRNRVVPEAFSGDEMLSIGVSGLDSLTGGGVIRGGTTVVEHDGNADMQAFLANVCRQALEEDLAIVLVPSVQMTPSRLSAIFEASDQSVDDLLAEQRLFILDAIGVHDRNHRNVLTLDQSATRLETTFETVDERRGDRELACIAHTETLYQALGHDEARRLRYWTEANFLDSDDLALYLHNPQTMPETLSAFYHDSAWQVLHTWLEDDGLQYFTLEKSPSGVLGSVRVVEYLQDPPYMRVIEPPESTIQ